MKRRLGAVITTIIILIAVATLAVTVQWSTTARSYQIRTVFQMAYAIWNDEQLLVLVRTRHDGTFPTVFEDVRDRVKTMLGSRTERPRSTHRSVGTILHVDAGAVKEFSEVVPSYREIRYPPSFIDGRPYVMGGVWTGRRVEDVPRQVQMRMTRSFIGGGGEDPGGWRFAMLVQHPQSYPYPPRSFDLPVRVRGEEMLLRGTDDTNQVVIELVGADGQVRRLWSQSTIRRGVSAREFEAILGTTHPR